ncbi:homocysteine S-methyltransferase family protein, partial [Striga asiatica]
MDLEFLKNFHKRRVKVLADSGPDLIAFETVPNKLEAQAFAELLEENEIDIPAWLSFNSKDVKLNFLGVSDKDFVSYVNKWCEAGASLVGGCCIKLSDQFAKPSPLDFEARSCCNSKRRNQDPTPLAEKFLVTN